MNVVWFTPSFKGGWYRGSLVCPQFQRQIAQRQFSFPTGFRGSWNTHSLVCPHFQRCPAQTQFDFPPQFQRQQEYMQFSFTPVSEEPGIEVVWLASSFSGSWQRGLFGLLPVSATAGIHIMQFAPSFICAKHRSKLACPQLQRQLASR